MVKCGRMMYDEIGVLSCLGGDLDERDLLYVTILEAKVSKAVKHLDLNILNLVRCGAHTLALAIDDELNRDETVRPWIE